MKRLFGYLNCCPLINAGTQASKAVMNMTHTFCIKKRKNVYISTTKAHVGLKFLTGHMKIPLSHHLIYGTKKFGKWTETILYF